MASDTGTSASTVTGSDGSDAQTETSATGETTATETETETGEMCTGEACASTLTLTFAHSLDLLAGPYRFLFDTPTHSVSCGVEASLSGAESCFGFPFSNVSWDEATVTVVLTSPFYPTDDNPQGLPFEAITLVVKQGQTQLFELPVAIDVGEPMQPDPCGIACWQAVGAATVE